MLIDSYRQSVGVTDPYFATVVQLSHLDGTDGQTGTYTNNSPYGLPFQSGGNDALSTAQAVFGPTSLRRGTGASTETTTHADFVFSTNEFTIEFRFRPDALQAKNIFDMRSVATQNSVCIYTDTSGAIYLFVNGATVISSAASLIAATTWAAIALSRVSGTTRLFVNGTQAGSSWTDATDYVGSNPHLGGILASFTDGHYDEFRISNGLYGAGAGRYASDYTPAITPFPDS